VQSSLRGVASSGKHSTSQVAANKDKVAYRIYFFGIVYFYIFLKYFLLFLLFLFLIFVFFLLFIIFITFLLYFFTILILFY